MGSYLSHIYYDTSNDFGAVAERSHKQLQDDVGQLPGGKENVCTSAEISGIHQHQSFETQKSLSWDTDRQFCSNDKNGLVTNAKCLDGNIILCSTNENSAGPESSCCESRNTSAILVENIECSTGTAHNPILFRQTEQHSKEIPTVWNENSTSSKLPISCAWEIDMTGSFVIKKKRRKKKDTGKGILKQEVKKTGNIKDENSDVTYSHAEAASVVTKETMALRKVFDQRRWYCMSRPQYSKSCGISSLVSCWNYLFSKLGTGSLQPISQEQAMTVLGFKPPFGEIRFGPFTGNATLMRWFQQLCNHYKVRGRACYLYKPKGKSRTVGITSEGALQKLKKGLQNEQTAVIYHCYNHYFCPVGYEEMPIKSLDAYRVFLPKDQTITWVLLCDPSGKHPAINSIRWSDIDTDLNCENPYHMNIRKLYKGIMERKTKKVGGNLHCLMAFQRSFWQGFKRSVVTKYQETDLEINPDTQSDESTGDSND